MKRRLIFTLAVALLLVATLSLPAIAATEDARTASVTVGEVISISLSDNGTAGINFGSQLPGATGVGDADQDDGSPAITVDVGSETNVNIDIGIKGIVASGTVALDNWKYSLTYSGTKTSLTTGYVKIYGPVGASSVNDVYHWLDVPSGADTGSHTVTVSYKAVKTGTSF